jgi:hypothetical protein
MNLDSIAAILGSLCPEIESQLKPSLRGIRGVFVQAYLPQAWVFETETETSTFVVDVLGNAHTEDGARPGRDVTICWKHALLTAVLRTGSRASVPGGIRPSIMFHTSKGRRAFILLRGRLGL